MAPMTIPGSEASLFFYPDNPPPNLGSEVIIKKEETRYTELFRGSLGGKPMHPILCLPFFLENSQVTLVTLLFSQRVKYTCHR